MIKREEISQYINKKYDIHPDYLWSKFPGYAASRHKESGKWFSLIMDVIGDKIGLSDKEEIDILNVKAEKEIIGALRNKSNIYAAYHMNKDNWITINLNETTNISQIKDLIEDSFNLTIRHNAAI